MARRSKKDNLSIDERIEQQQQLIEKLTNDLKEAKVKLKKLNEEKVVEDNEKIIDAIKSSGKSIDEIINLINS